MKNPITSKPLTIYQVGIQSEIRTQEEYAIALATSLAKDKENKNLFEEYRECLMNMDLKTNHFLYGQYKTKTVHVID